MRISRIFTDQTLEPDRSVELDDRAGRYLSRVLRLRGGDRVVLFNGDGCDYAAELTDNRRDRVQAQVLARLPAVAEPALDILLVQAVGKGDRMDYCLQKATELGVGSIQPLFSERTEVRLKGTRLTKRMDHWRGVIIAACEQSGRARLPLLKAPLDVPSWLATAFEGPRFVLAPNAERPLADAQIDKGPVAVVVGPEGGFSDVELRHMTLAGCDPVQMGQRVLRTETAGPAALVVLQTLWGDFRAA